MAESPREQVSLFEDRMEIAPDGGTRLLGINCNACDITVFPGSELCPSCGRGDVAEVTLSGRGRIWTYTIIHVSYGSIALEPPYVGAFVELEDGAFIHTLIVGCDPGEVEIGMEVQLDTIKASGDEENKEAETVVYAFRPAASGDLSQGLTT